MSHESNNSPKNLGIPRPNLDVFYKRRSFSSKENKDHISSVPAPSKLSIKRRFSFHSQKKAVSVSNNKTSLSSKYYNKNLSESYLMQCFDNINELGSGSFAQVFKARSKDDGQFYAIKKSKQKYSCSADRERKLNEVQKLMQLSKHPNCIEFCDAWEEDGDLYIQLELCQMTLAEYCNDKHNIPESIVWNIFIDLLLALKHVHDNNIIHLDIKPENIFIANDVWKLGDFGLALDATKTYFDPEEGDSKYLAPEIMGNIFTKAADIFSLGITILEVASDLDVPRCDSPWRLLRENEIPSQFLLKLSSELRVVIQKMMEKNYELRPSINDILKMNIVKDFLEKRNSSLSETSKDVCVEQSKAFPGHNTTSNAVSVCASSFRELSEELGKEIKLSDFSTDEHDEHLPNDGTYKTDDLNRGDSVLPSVAEKSLSIASSPSSTGHETPRKFRKLSLSF